MGYYQGLGGRLVVQTDFVAGQGRSPRPVVTPGVGTVSCPWSPTLTLNITKDWPPGCYLLKLVGDGGEEQFVPLTIRDDASTASYVLQNSVTTWQAYNLWGSYSLYYGPDGSGRSRLRQPRPRRVLRPPLPPDLGLGRGRLRRQRAAAPLPPREPRSGPDLLDRRRPARPAAAAHEPPLPLQPGPRRVLVPAHAPGRGDGQRRAASTWPSSAPTPATARSACSRPRSAPTACRSATRTPPRTRWPASSRRSPRSTGTRPRSTTPSRPSSAPCTSRSGPRPTWWSPTRRRGSTTAATSPTATPSPPSILGEYDRYVPSLPGPRNVDVLAHSPVPGQSNWSDITYYTAPGNGGGVLASGSASFVSLLGTTGAIPPIVIPGAIPGVTDVIRRAMENVYGRFGLGPASSYGSSGGNWIGGLHRCRRRGGHRRRAPRPPDASRLGQGSRRARAAGMTPLAGAALVRSSPQRWRIPAEHRTRARRPLAWGVLATAGLAGLLLSACSSSPAPATPRRQSKPTTTTSTAPPPACPLTGAPAPGGSVPQRPAMAVKIDNYPAGRPQSGLDKADIVFEEPVEGGITRYAAVFQCQDAALIGPVRSARNIDIGILGQLGTPLLAHVGGINPVLANIDASPIVNVDLGASNSLMIHPAGPRAPGRRLHLDAPSSTAPIPTMTTPPQPLFTYSTALPAGGTPVSSVNIDFSGTSNVTWKWNQRPTRSSASTTGRRPTCWPTACRTSRQRRGAVRADQLRALGSRTPRAGLEVQADLYPERQRHGRRLPQRHAPSRAPGTAPRWVAHAVRQRVRRADPAAAGADLGRAGAQHHHGDDDARSDDASSRPSAASAPPPPAAGIPRRRRTHPGARWPRPRRTRPPPRPRASG